MRQRQRAGKPAQITFTLDFHELVTGDLRPGGSLLLRYDPHRILPAGEPYRFGQPDRPVTAHLRFHEGGAAIDVVLASPSGVVPCPAVDPTGQGSMLSAQVDVPADADRVIVWFTYAGAASTVCYDSDYGADYRFGFPCREIGVVQATVGPGPDTSADRFELVVGAAPAVEAVTAPYTRVADPACTRYELRLQRTAERAADGQSVLWSGSNDVPHGAVLRFKVCYWIGGRRLVDDNTGAYYLAPEPEAERLPPPPPALIEAAAKWR